MKVSILLVAFFLGLTAAQYPEPTCPVNEKPHCAVRCAQVVAPVCASPNGWIGEPQTFINSCQVAGYNCKCRLYQYKVSYVGECRNTCLTVCPSIYTPICGLPINFCGKPKTFSNQCALSSHNCINTQKYKYFHEGECEKGDNCNMACPENYEPICGLPVNGCGENKDFSNNCQMNLYNCENPSRPYYEYSHTTCKDIRCDENIAITSIVS